MRFSTEILDKIPIDVIVVLKLFVSTVLASRMNQKQKSKKL